jgi:hypothetical protein
MAAWSQGQAALIVHTIVHWNQERAAKPWKPRWYGGEGGIRTHGTVTRTTVFEFYDSRADPYRRVAKRALWFANLASTILPCIVRYRSVPRSWFAIWFAKLVTTDVRLASKADLSDTRHYVSDPKRTCIHVNERLHCGGANWGLGHCMSGIGIISMISIQAPGICR